ncbi:glycosyltransferase family 8 protein [Campylobacter lanienae]|uniref:glycosyltransferase family 8 protein n=1 Tax=Campylobacter lanienae TaxID=75658 RepID=UPI00242EC8AF|nr:glycosyltransferase family 8 protein [Campylobacter lanienae]MDD5786137.1 glycosyltransferase family 8 protein [Campylobacter lanienae]
MFHIVFSADENYIKYTAVLINSIIKNTNLNLHFKDFCQKPTPQMSPNSSVSSYENLNFDDLSAENRAEGYVFHILSDQISTATQNKLKALEKSLNEIYPCLITAHILNDDEFSDFPVSGAAHSNFLPYYRLKLKNYLNSSVDRCLYLDSDMLCLCDLRELFAIDLKDNILAAINDPGSKKRKIKFKQNSNIITHKFTNDYFNSGFLLINTKAYIENKIEQKCQSLAKNATYIKAADQDLLNATIPANKLLKLPISYNFSSISFCFAICKDEQNHRLNCSRAEFMQSYKKPKIIHYGEKPWRFLKSYTDGQNRNINDIWWEYAANTPEFRDELMAMRNDINEYKVFATLGFEILKALKSIFGYFVIKNLIDKPLDNLNLNSEIPDDIFGLCCILGEMIIHAKRHKKSALSVILKAYKMKTTFTKYNTKNFL